MSDLNELKDQVVEILKEMKKTGVWNTTKTKSIFKYNNELNMPYETNYGCSDCVKRVYDRLVTYFAGCGIEI